MVVVCNALPLVEIEDPTIQNEICALVKKLKSYQNIREFYENF